MSSPDETWEARLSGLSDESSEEQVSTLASELAHSATAPGRAAVKTWQSEKTQQLGRQLLVGLDFAALMGTVYADAHVDPTSRAWLLTNMVESELHLRGQIASKLREALFDKALVSEPSLPVAIEETPPQRRVCDDAYLLLRQLFHPEEDQVGFSVERDAYLKMPDSLRDQAIERALIEGAWKLSPFDLY